MTEAKTIKLSEMILTCNEEADHIEACEQAAMITGFREAPLPDRMHKAEVFRAIARYLDRIAPKLNAVNAVLRGKSE